MMSLHSPLLPRRLLQLQKTPPACLRRFEFPLLLLVQFEGHRELARLSSYALQHRRALEKQETD